MDGYVIDSNVIFSTVFNIKSGIGQFILKSKKYHISLFAPVYLKSEINNHFKKIIQLSALSKTELDIIMAQVYRYITFIDDKIIPFQSYVKAMRLVRDIDPDDVTFVALANYLNLALWTGDTVLYQGLKKKGFRRNAHIKRT